MGCYAEERRDYAEFRKAFSLRSLAVLRAPLRNS